MDLQQTSASRLRFEAVLSMVRRTVLPRIEDLAPLEASIIDGTGFPKKSGHLGGVARQCCGQLGNCQTVVSLSYASRHARCSSAVSA